MPLNTTAALGLLWRGRAQAILGDSSQQTFDVYEASALWNGSFVRIEVDAADSEPLLGMSLLYGCELHIQVIDGGSVTIQPLA